MASTSGWIRFSSRWKRVPTTFVTRLLSIRLLTIQPVGGDVAAHRFGHEIAYRASQSRPLPHERRRHVERRYFDDPADQGVVGDGDEVRAAARQRVEVERQGGDERLAFAGRHLRDLPLVQYDAPDQLHVVG